MRIITGIALGASVVATAACFTGPKATSYYGVTEGSGIKATIHLHHGKTKGELLEVNDSALVLLDGCKVNIVGFAAIKEADFSGINPEYRSGMPSSSERAELKALSRFPGGAPKEVIDHYLKCEPASAPTVVGIASDSDSAAAFLATARVAVRRYATLDSAVVAGYRQLGGDLPSLGEHWIHPALVMSGGIDPTRPSVLIYIRTASGPVLAGAAWTKVLGPGEAYPSRPVGAGAWHEHNGSVAEETLPMMHQHGVMQSNAATRVAILHAWIGIENPRGVWVAENWALPFARVGLRADGASPASARAMSLTAPGAIAYYERVIASAAGSDSIVAARVHTLVASSAAQAMEVRRVSTGEVSDAEQARLDEIWSEMLTEMISVAPPSKSAGMEQLVMAMR